MEIQLLIYKGLSSFTIYRSQQKLWRKLKESSSLNSEEMRLSFWWCWSHASLTELHHFILAEDLPIAEHQQYPCDGLKHTWVMERRLWEGKFGRVVPRQGRAEQGRAQQCKAGRQEERPAPRKQGTSACACYCCVSCPAASYFPVFPPQSRPQKWPPQPLAGRQTNRERSLLLSVIFWLKCEQEMKSLLSLQRPVSVLRMLNGTDSWWKTSSTPCLPGSQRGFPATSLMHNAAGIR